MNGTDGALQLDNQVCFAVYAAAHAFSAAYKPLLEPFGLTYPQYLVLLVLWERDGVNLKEVGQRLQLDAGTLTPLLKRLEAGGLVTRDRDPEDERRVIVALTDQGRALRDQAVSIPEKLFCALDMPLDAVGALRERLKTVAR